MKCLSLCARVVFILALAFTAISTFATTPSRIHGTVRDPLGAVVPGAQVELLHEGARLAAVATDFQGNYTITSIEAGHYQVRVSAPRFAQQTSDPIYINGVAVADMTLRLGTVAQQVVVTDSGTSVPDSQMGAAVSVITANLLDHELGVLQPVRQVPGVQVLDNGQQGVVTSLFIRGGNSTANKFLLDGIPADEIGGRVDFGGVFATGIDHVEVLRGPNSVLYGSDAMAGVVNMTTRRGSTHLPQLSYAFDAGNFGSLQHDVDLGGAFHQLDYFSEFSRFDTRNAEPNATFHNSTFAGNLGWTPLASTDLRLTVRRVAATVGLPNAIDYFGIADDSFQSQHNTYISAALQNRTTEHWHNSVRYGAVRLDSEFVNPSPTGTPDTLGFGNFLGDTLTIRGANGFSATGQAILDFGGPYPQQFFSLTNRDFVAVQSDYTFNHNVTALFAFRYDNERAGTLERSNFSYTGELHGSLWNRLFATAGVGVENSGLFGTVASPRASLAYYLVRPRASGRLTGTRLKANYGQGIKEPDAFSQTNSLFALLSQIPGGDQLITQSHVRPIGPERSRSFDVGVDQFAWNSRAKLGVNFFYSKFADQIEDVSGGGLILLGVPQPIVNNTPLGATVNSETTRALGAETELQLFLGRGLTASASYTYLDAVVQRSFSSDELFPSFNPAFPNIPIGAFSPLVGNRPFNRAPHSGAFALGYTQPKYTLTATGNIVSRRDGSTFLSDVNFGSTLLLPNRNLAPSYHRIDLGGTYHFTRRLDFFASVQNLTSQHYESIPGFPALPLTFRAGMKIRLGGESWK